MENEELDVTKLKYALYARKSTDDPKRQIRSIPDQIAECMDHAKGKGLNVVGKPLIEKRSAKIPDQRPVFNQLLKDIRKGKYDAILSWNPDRLARNMKEAGVLIDMADAQVIKDFKFVTHPYTPDANGKMLLGMAFVLSKQYSDDLSQKVTRGVKRKFAEGKSNTPKHGYINDGAYYRPDGRNFELLSEAWQKRLSGEAIMPIVDWLNSNGYHRLTKTGRKIEASKQILSGVFREPFYYGILIQNNETIDLRENPDFIPMVSEEDYFSVQQMTRGKKSFPKVAQSFYPLKQMVTCALCGSSMVVGPSKSGGGGLLLYYRCDNKECYRNSKENKLKKKRKEPGYISPNTRGYVIFDWIVEFLKNGVGFTEKEYNDNLIELEKTKENKIARLKKEQHNREGSMKQLQGQIRQRSLKIVNYEVGSTIEQENQREIDRLIRLEGKLKQEITSVKKEMEAWNNESINFDEFLNLSKNAPDIVNAGNAYAKDAVCRIIFLNFTVDDKNVLKYEVKELFKTLIKAREVSSGRGDRT